MQRSLNSNTPSNRNSFLIRDSNINKEELTKDKVNEDY